MLLSSQVFLGRPSAAQEEFIINQFDKDHVISFTFLDDSIQDVHLYDKENLSVKVFTETMAGNLDQTRENVKSVVVGRKASIDNCAFRYMSNMTDITLDSETDISPDTTFAFCHNLSGIHGTQTMIGIDGNEYIVLFNNPKYNTLIRTFAECYTLSGNFAFPSITYLNSATGSPLTPLFYCCGLIKRLYFPKVKSFTGSVKGITTVVRAFQLCNSLEYIYMPEFDGYFPHPYVPFHWVTSIITVDFRGRTLNEDGSLNIPIYDSTWPSSTIFWFDSTYFDAVIATDGWKDVYEATPERIVKKDI